MKTFPSKLFPSDVQALSLFRILLGLIILADFFFTILPCVPDIYLDDGFFPRSIFMQMGHHASNISLLMLTGYPGLIYLFFAVYVCALISFIIGYRTTLSKWVVFICYSSILYRGIIIFGGGDKLIRLFLLWSLFVPMHRYWSVDAALSRAPRDTPVPGILMAGIKSQIFLLYIFGAIFKLYSPWWRDGTAISHVLNDTIWTTFLGHFFATYGSFLLMPLTYGIILFQLAFVVLINASRLQPYMRIAAILGAAAMHASFLFFLNVGVFPYICLAYLVLLIPDTWWNRLFARRRARCEKIVIYFEDGCNFCEKIALLFREFCLSPFSHVRPASDDPDMQSLLHRHKSWIVKDMGMHKIYMKWEAVAFLLRQSFVFWPFGVITDLPYIRKLFACVYDWIGNHRQSLAAITARALPFHDDVYRPTQAAKVICSLFIVLAVIGNIMSTPSLENRIKAFPALKNILSLSQTYQQWNLFAPNPTSYFYAYTLEGITRSGKTVDLKPLFEEGRFNSSDSAYWTFSSHRWLEFYTQINTSTYHPVLQSTLQTVVERYNARTTDSADQLISARVALRRELIDDFKKGIPPLNIASAVWVAQPTGQITPPLPIAPGR